MKINFPKLEPALYLISTPIGTLSDFTFRAINVLQNVNVLLAEDTRVLRKLMNLMDIDLNGRNISSYNDNSGDEVRSKYILELEQNKSIALCCDSQMKRTLVTGTTKRPKRGRQGRDRRRGEATGAGQREEVEGMGSIRPQSRTGS